MRKAVLLAGVLMFLALPLMAQAQMANPAGLWLARSAQLEWILLLAPSGDYAEKVTTQQGVNQYKGKWRVQGSQLIVQVEGSQQPAVLQFQMPDNNTLSLSMNGQFLGSLVRQQIPQQRMPQQQMPQQQMPQQQMPQQQMPQRQMPQRQVPQQQAPFQQQYQPQQMPQQQPPQLQVPKQQAPFQQQHQQQQMPQQQAPQPPAPQTQVPAAPTGDTGSKTK